jgi:hypothetical protein
MNKSFRLTEIDRARYFTRSNFTPEELAYARFCYRNRGSYGYGGAGEYCLG